MRCPKNRSINYAEWGRSTTKRQHQQQQRTHERGLERRRREKNKSYRNIYIKLNCTMKEYLYNAWRGTRLFVKRASFLWRHRLNGKHSIRSITMEIMDKTHTHTQIFFRTIFYKQSDNRFLMASLRFFFSFSFLFVLFFSPVLFSLSLVAAFRFKKIHITSSATGYQYHIGFYCYMRMCLWTDVRLLIR